MVKVAAFRSWNFNARDIDATVRFYQDVLGADVSMEHTIGGARVVRMRVGGVGLGVFDATDGPRPGVPHHTFAVEGPADSRELVDEIEAKGFKVESVREHRGGAGYSVYVSDPAGNRVELSVGEG
ncbi:MAG: VOC family protein [SAR202 cluster bacterium]|nr:VOC family protein [SAR202 cluster bacterium]